MTSRRSNAVNRQEELFPSRKIRYYLDHDTPTDQWSEEIVMLPEICLRVRMSINGAADPWDTEGLVKVRDMLQARIDEWRDPSDMIDGLIRLMAIETVRMASVEIERRKADGW